MQTVADNLETANRAELLERIMDSVGNMTDFADMLSAICSEKSEHLLANWQDTVRAKCWSGWAQKFDAMSARLADPYSS